eukprot:9503508-Pyramimonas_sp.AAC.1
MGNLSARMRDSGMHQRGGGHDRGRRDDGMHDKNSALHAKPPPPPPRYIDSSWAPPCLPPYPSISPFPLDLLYSISSPLNSPTPSGLLALAVTRVLGVAVVGVIALVLRTREVGGGGQRRVRGMQNKGKGATTPTPYLYHALLLRTLIVFT